MSGRTLDAPLIVVAEYYASGGTRTYIKQLLEFYGERNQPVILVACHPEPDAEIREILDRFAYGYRNYSDILAGGSPPGADPVLPRVWSMSHHRRERRAFARFVDDIDAMGIVVTVGTPGQFAGASSSCTRGLYILHTYPHGRRQQWLGKFVMARLFRNTKRFVAVSEFQKSAMIRHWRLESRTSDITVIPNTAGPALPARGRPSGHPMNVITASWVEPYKAPETWLDVAAQVLERTGVGKVCFTWMGEGSQLTSLRAAVRARGFGGAVDFPGHVDDVGPSYAGATAYLQMSTTENMSLAVIEALRYGLPAVVTDVGGLVEIVEDGVSGFVVAPGDVEAAATMVEHLLDDTGLWTSVAQAARERYDAKFSPHRWESSMTAVHEGLFGMQERSHGQ